MSQVKGCFYKTLFFPKKSLKDPKKNFKNILKYFFFKSKNNYCLVFGWFTYIFYTMPILEKIGKKRSEIERNVQCTSLQKGNSLVSYEKNLLCFWTFLRFHKNLRRATNFKIVFSEHLLRG